MIIVVPGSPHFSVSLGPVELGTLLRFGLAALLIELTPGPNMGYLAIVAAQRGRRAGLVVVGGVAVGLAIYLGAVVLGVAEGALSNWQVYQAIRWAGVAYILWLAVEAWRSKPAASFEPLTATDSALLFGRGLIANLLNVKAAIFYALLLPAFVDVTRSGLAIQALILGTTHIVIATLVHLTIVMIASQSHELLSPRTSSCFGKVYAFGLLVVAVWLAWSTRSLI